MDEYIGKICPYCKTAIEETDEVTVCPSCGIPHHTGCWEENKGCTTFGCSEQHYDEQHTNPTDVCRKCGAPLGDGQMFCPKCGTPKGSTGKKVCSKCGIELHEDQQFCPNCGQKATYDYESGYEPAAVDIGDASQKEEKKPVDKNKIKIAAAVVIAVILVLIFSNASKKPKSVILSESSITIERGETYTLDYEVKPDKAYDYEIMWYSKDDEVASVDGDGVVEGNSVGECKIEVRTDNGKSDVCNVEVVMPSEEKKVLGKWEGVTALFLDSSSNSFNCTEFGYEFTLNDDNTGSWTSNDGLDQSFEWGYAKTNSYGNYLYYTTIEDIYFCYSTDDYEIWLYVELDDDTLCITFE